MFCCAQIGTNEEILFFDIRFPDQINNARNTNRGSNWVYPFFGGIPVTGLIGALFALFFRITED